jgi:hypothetical protein
MRLQVLDIFQISLSSAKFERRLISKKKRLAIQYQVKGIIISLLKHPGGFSAPENGDCQTFLDRAYTNYFFIAAHLGSPLFEPLKLPSQPRPSSSIRRS